MTRRRFVRVLAGTAGAGVVAVTGGLWVADHHLSGHNHARRILRFGTMEEALAELDRLTAAPDLQIDGQWNLYQNLSHCAQSIEYSMQGFPQAKPRWFQVWIGKPVFGKFERQGYMRHDRNEALPAAPVIPASPDWQQAAQRLRQAISAFDGFQGVLQPHFAYGLLTKTQYAKAHAMHLADHFAAMQYGG